MLLTTAGCGRHAMSNSLIGSGRFTPGRFQRYASWLQVRALHVNPPPENLASEKKLLGYSFCLLFLQAHTLRIPTPQLMTKGTDYTVIGVLGAPGAGKSRLMNELCGNGPCAELWDTHVMAS